jgi:hypothetical protein
MKFLLVDDHPMLREGVAAVLRQFDADAWCKPRVRRPCARTRLAAPSSASI